MASIKKSRTLLAFTSPRTVEKIIPEIDLLVKNFSGKKWEGNPDLHKEFFDELYNSEFYEGETYPSDPGFAGRDRITRAPKAYGFIDLKPTVELTPAGNDLITSKRPSEVFLKQMLKFQLPSPYHTNNNTYNVKPYLELLRLIYTTGGISKTELALFFLQLIHHNKFDLIVDKIKHFRTNAKKFKGSRKIYVDKCLNEEIMEIFVEEITLKQFKTRESSDTSFAKFLKTKKQTLKDYADAYMRHIKATGMISFEKKTLRLIINPTKIKDVEFILRTINKEAIVFKTTKDFKDYLFSNTNIKLYSDDKKLLIKKLEELGDFSASLSFTTDELKDKIEYLEKTLLEEKISTVSKELKSYKEFDDIIDIFEKIKSKDVPDAPLFLEWNVWRALVMINYSKRVDGNFIMDLEGIPLNTAGGNKPDIEAEYDNFGLITEVTMSGGNTQYNMEGESVPRHFGKFKKEIEKETYCLFVAPKISEGALAHYFNLNRFNTKAYGGKTKIIPLSINQFIDFIKEARDNKFNNSSKLQAWMEKIVNFNQSCEDEDVWYSFIDSSISGWAA